MEAALRTAVEILTGKDLDNIDFTAVRGIEGVKEASVTVAGMDVKRGCGQRHRRTPRS